MWLKCSLCSKNCFFKLLSAIFFGIPITRTPDNSNLFSISLEGSSYRELTVVVEFLYKLIFSFVGTLVNQAAYV